MDWYKTLSAGAKFAYIRAGSCQSADGVCYTDQQFERNAAIAANYLPIGFYWYFRPNWSPTTQAQYFVGLIGLKKWSLPPVIDVECQGGCNPEQIRGAIKIFLYQIYHYLDTDCVIYTRGEWWNRCVADDEAWSDLALWVARYTTLPQPWGNPDDKECLKPRNWSAWTIWQFSADGNGRGKEFGAKSESTDLDWYFGDEKQFEYWVGCKIPAMVKIKAAAAALAYRHWSSVISSSELMAIHYLSRAEQSREYVLQVRLSMRTIRWITYPSQKQKTDLSRQTEKTALKR